MSRVPPHSLDAEESLLGAALLNRDARRFAVDSLTPADFYAPVHAVIFGAIADLVEAGSAVDPTTVAERLRILGEFEHVGGRRALLRLQAATPASANARDYARIIAETARLRHVVAFSESLAEAAWTGANGEVDRLLDIAPDTLAPVLPTEDPSVELDALLARPDRDPKQWVVPGLMQAGDVLVLTGGEGAGKMTVLRQLAMGAAAGLHPFTGQPMPRQRVLILDLQEDEHDLRAELAPLRAHVAGHYATGSVRLVARRQGVNLLGARDARMFEALLKAHRPTLVIMGPLKKMYAAPPGRGIWDDDVIEGLHRRFDEWIVEHGFALCLEGHAGHDRDTWRVKGSSAWYAWPHFGYGLNPVSWRPRQVGLVRWRGDRENGVRRYWPSTLTESHGWPWSADDDSVTDLRRVNPNTPPRAVPLDEEVF